MNKIIFKVSACALALSGLLLLNACGSSHHDSKSDAASSSSSNSASNASVIQQYLALPKNQPDLNSGVRAIWWKSVDYYQSYPPYQTDPKEYAVCADDSSKLCFTPIFMKASGTYQFPTLSVSERPKWFGWVLDFVTPSQNAIDYKLPDPENFDVSKHVNTYYTLKKQADTKHYHLIREGLFNDNSLTIYPQALDYSKPDKKQMGEILMKLTSLTGIPPSWFKEFYGYEYAPNPILTMNDDTKIVMFPNDGKALADEIDGYVKQLKNASFKCIPYKTVSPSSNEGKIHKDRVGKLSSEQCDSPMLTQNSHARWAVGCDSKACGFSWHIIYE
jgi:hypothetical protein